MSGMDRTGTSLAELLVALTLLAAGGSFAAGVLLQAAVQMESAELGVRATLLLSELNDGAAGGGPLEIGPGVLVPEAAADEGMLRVRYEPWSGADAAPGGGRGFRTPRTWVLREGAGG